MVALIRRLTNLRVVSGVLQTPAKYPSVRNGFARDRQKLSGDKNRVVSHMNQISY